MGCDQATAEVCKGRRSMPTPLGPVRGSNGPMILLDLKPEKRFLEVYTLRSGKLQAIILLWQPKESWIWNTSAARRTTSIKQNMPKIMMPTQPLLVSHKKALFLCLLASVAMQNAGIRWYPYHYIVMISVTSWAPNKAVQRDFTSRVQRTGCDFVAISYVSAHVSILNVNKLSYKLLCIHIYIYHNYIYIQCIYHYIYIYHNIYTYIYIQCIYHNIYIS